MYSEYRQLAARSCSRWAQVDVRSRTCNQARAWHLTCPTHGVRLTRREPEAHEVLVTGGTGVVGESAVRALHERGHHVRVLTRHAGRDQKWWPDGVEGVGGRHRRTRSPSAARPTDARQCSTSPGSPRSIRRKRPFSRSTSMERATSCSKPSARESSKLVYVSSLGADRGKSEYHKSKRVAEDVVAAFIARLGRGAARRGLRPGRRAHLGAASHGAFAAGDSDDRRRRPEISADLARGCRRGAGARGGARRRCAGRCSRSPDRR